jgi:hypothetical protein
MCDLPTRRRLSGDGSPVRVGLRSGFTGLLCRQLPGWHGVLGPVRDWVTSPLAIAGVPSVTTPSRRAASEMTKLHSSPT